MSAKTPVAATLITSQSLSAGSAARYAYDCRELDSGIITARITNGASAPGVACQFAIYISHTTGATPTAAAEGTADTDWKRVFVRSGDLVANSSYRWNYNFGPEVQHVMVEFGSHTTNAVTVESGLSGASY